MKKNREFRLERGGEFHRSDSEARDSVTFDIKNLAPRVFRVTLGSELGKGEYGFLAPNDAGDLGSSAGYAKMYTFSAGGIDTRVPGFVVSLVPKARDQGNPSTPN
jgi:hypothetical protein